MTRSGASRPQGDRRRLTDPRAFAWIVARLAEALDHAYSQGVAHGDVKPSNILLTADGDPMLLDFNLARDWSFHGPETPVADPGGTLAYMAPERLRLTRREASRARIAGGSDVEATAADPHRADVYSLGVVLLEAVAGSAARRRGPRFPPGRPDARSPKPPNATAELRDRGPAEIVQRAEAAGGGTVPATLRSILLHCLEVDPSARYARAWELAEDLDRWLADRRLELRAGALPTPRDRPLGAAEPPGDRDRGLRADPLDAYGGGVVASGSRPWRSP